MNNASASDLKRANESCSVQTEKEKHHLEAFRITNIPKRLRYSADSSNMFMRKQHQVSGAASIEFSLLRTSDGLCSVKDLSSSWLLTKSKAFYWNTYLPLWIVVFCRSRLCITFLDRPVLPGMLWKKSRKVVLEHDFETRGMYESVRESKLGWTESFCLCSHVVSTWFRCLMAHRWNFLPWNQIVPVVSVGLPSLTVCFGSSPLYAHYESLRGTRLLFIL